MKRFFIIIGISIVSQVAMAQWRITATISSSGNCKNIGGGVHNAIAKAMIDDANSLQFDNEDLCRRYCNNLIREYSTTHDGCTTRVVATCHGLGGGSNGGINVLGVGQGTSFNSTNPVNEINDWSNDDMERMLALNPEYKPKETKHIVTGDPSFDNLIENMPYSDEAFSGRMPRGSTHIKTDDNITAIGQPVKGNGVLVPDDFTSTPFKGLGVWYSDDLKPAEIPQGTVRLYGDVYNVDKKEGITDKVKKALSSLDDRLDWYKAEDANVFQYMYTRLAKENVMAGIDWWENNQIGNRISNAFTTVKETVTNAIDHPIDTYDNVRNATLGKIKENIDDGIKSTVLFMLPPQYQNSGERLQGIYDAEKGTITDVFGIIKKAPDMIIKGETFDTDAVLGKEMDRYMGLAASYGSPTTNKAYAHLKSASDIYNMPKEQQGKGLAKWFGKEAKKEAQKRLKDSSYGEKWNKKVKSVIGPYSIIYD